MPAQGFPIILEKILHTFLEQDMLKTWTLLQEQNGNIVVKLRFYGTHHGQGNLNLATGDQGGELSFKSKSAKQNLRDRERSRAHHQQQNTSPALPRSRQSEEPEIARDEPSFYEQMTSHISLECALNPNASTFVGQSADNYVLPSSPGLQTSKDMITNTVSELNISNDYFTANIEEVESDTHPTASVSPPPKLNETDTKLMTSNLTETDSDDSDDKIPDCKHCDICNLEFPQFEIAIQRCEG